MSGRFRGLGLVIGESFFDSQTTHEDVKCKWITQIKLMEKRYITYKCLVEIRGSTRARARSGHLPSQ